MKDVDGKFEVMKKMITSKTESMELDVEELQQLAQSFEEKHQEMYQQHRLLGKQQDGKMEFMQEELIKIVKEKEKSEQLL